MQKTMLQSMLTLLALTMILALTACGVKPTTSTASLTALPVVNCNVDVASQTLDPVPDAPAVHGPSYYTDHPERFQSLLADYTRLFSYDSGQLIPWTLHAAQTTNADIALRAATATCIHTLRSQHVIN